MKKALLWGAVMCAALCAMLVFTGCPEDEPEPDKPFTLTVTGLETLTGKIWGASLLKEDDIDHPFATGVPGPEGTFTFYHPNETGRMPDYAKPFTTAGNYLVALAQVNFATFQEEAVYFYTENGTRKPVAFPATASLSRSAFELKED